MKKKPAAAIIATSLAIVFSIGQCWADEKLSRWSIGAEVSQIEYEEPGIMRNEGWMTGLVVSYNYVDISRNVLELEGRIAGGRVDYSSPQSGKMDDIEDALLELRGAIGRPFDLSEGSIAIPYIGLGYRYLNDDSSGKVTNKGYYGYERESNYLYAPIGARLIRPLGSGWILGLNAEYDIFLRGKQVSHLSDVDPAYNDLENTQKNGYGYRGSISFVKMFRELRGIAVEPFIRYWNIDDSKSSSIKYSGTKVGDGYEPHNRTTEYGLKVALTFF